MAMSEQIVRATRGSAGLKRHLDTDVRAQPLRHSEFRAIGQVGRKEAAFVADIRLFDQLEVGPAQRLEDAVPVSGTLAPCTAGASRRRLSDLEIDVLGKTLDETPNPSRATCRWRRPAPCRQGR